MHYQLSLTMQMITTFGIKHTKPFNNLFDSMVIGLYFTDLQQKSQVRFFSFIFCELYRVKNVRYLQYYVLFSSVFLNKAHGDHFNYLKYYLVILQPFTLNTVVRQLEKQLVCQL